MKVDITSRQTIKPSFPTPNHHRNFRLSLLDQLSPTFYGLIVFFYAASPSTHLQNGDCRYKSSERSCILKSSLSKALTHFYPMAGRLKDAASIDCNDEGAYFVEGRIDCKLSDFLKQPDMEALNGFLPTTDPETSEAASGCILLVQLTTFDCGGTALSICLLHKITDVSSLVTFLQSWTAISRDSGEAVLSPEFVGASLLPPRDLSFLPPVNIPSGNFITKRFVFEGSKIARLKVKAAGLFVPSRVEVVLALIVKCSVVASRAKSGSARPVVLFQAVNLRKRMVPPLPENSIGNLIWPMPVFIGDDEMELNKLVSVMRRGMTEFCKEKANKFKGDEGFLLITESLKERRELCKDAALYRCTSWCRFPLYEMDYGWGRPVWVSSVSLSLRNTVVLVDTKQGDGIEAWVTLDEQEMSIFERDKELIGSALVNPSIFI
ncbi:BAHD acyltransferase BIA1-like [Durio zibethinus]|uniref:BAHD acyltransferase BIA1-like n=1 Tax=Durio zibethinus TaxID=66656 RepID=A0A6P5Y202_DURZI|nr:BAHD acyltransferase BIA1-like [Durio zibethinus]